MSEIENSPDEEVLVIGAGIVGLAVARELLLRGARVRVIDKGLPGHGCSFGNAGWLTPCFAMPLPQPGLWKKALRWMFDPQGPLYIRPLFNRAFVSWMWRFAESMNSRHFLVATEALTALSKRSLEAYQRLSLAHAFGFQQTGLLLAFETDGGRRDALRELECALRFGVAGHALEADPARAEEPALQHILGAILFPQEAHVEPLQTVGALEAEVLRLGGTIESNVEVYDFAVSGQRVDHILTTAGSKKAGRFVLATGAWSKKLASLLGVNVPVLGGKGYAVNVERPPFILRRPTLLLERKIALTPREGALRVAGTLELVMDDLSLNAPRVDALWKGVNAVLPLGDKAQPFQHVWRGLRPCTPDGLPVIDFAPRLSNVFVVTGHQMLGLQTATASAEVAADLLEGKKPDWVDSHLFEASRFS
jgi:D-amino-acid dehydrogenase